MNNISVAPVLSTVNDNRYNSNSRRDKPHRKRSTTEAPLFHGRTWGEWVLDTERLCLVFQGEPATRGDASGVTSGVPQYTAFLGPYEIDLEHIRDSAAMLDWIYQFGSTFWATARAKSDLQDAFNAIFKPQASLCSGACGNGRGGKTIANVGAFLRARIAAVGKTSGSLVGAA